MCGGRAARRDAAVSFLDAGDLTGAALGVDTLPAAISAAATLSVVPFLVLVSYVLRVVTVVEWTLTTGEFVLRGPEGPGER